VMSDKERYPLGVIFTAVMAKPADGGSP
jgi:hypothetical protein